jgi:hypothetical protein
MVENERKLGIDLIGELKAAFTRFDPTNTGMVSTRSVQFKVYRIQSLCRKSVSAKPNMAILPITLFSYQCKTFYSFYLSSITILQWEAAVV